MTSPAEHLNSLPSTSRFRGWLLGSAISLAISLVIVSPFFSRGNASGHDFQFHAASWLDAAGQWKEGVCFPRWAEWANHGFGEPRFIFYPPASWMLGAALSFVAPWNHVPVVFIVLVQTLAGLSAFAFARHALSERGALLCAAFYAANPYALLLIYMRSDFAEELAAAFFPLLILTALQVCGILETRDGSKRRVMVCFAAVFAAVWLSNAPAGVLASYSVTLLFVWAALTEKSWRPLARGAAGLALGFGFAGVYLVPAAYEQRWVNISQALSSGLLPSQNFLFAQMNDPEHNLFNLIASSAALLLVVSTATAAIAARRTLAKSKTGKEATMLWRSLLLLAAASTLLMLRFTSIFWDLLPKLRFVQFPWRWMSILAVPFAFLLATAMERRRWSWLGAIAVFAMLGGARKTLEQQAWWDTEDIPVLRQAIANGEGFDGTDEYDPLGDDHYDLPVKAPDARIIGADNASSASSDSKIHVDRWTAEEKELTVTSSGPARIGLRLLNYPAWRVEVNGAAIVAERAEDSGQMIVPVPRGESRIRVHFARTLDRTLGGALSVVSLIGALLLWCWPVRRQSRS